MIGFIASIILILGFLGTLSLVLLIAGVTSLFDGSPLWFGLTGIALGVLGFISTHYHTSQAWDAYKKFKTMENRHDR